jgi:hypothetical protein
MSVVPHGLEPQAGSPLGYPVMSFAARVLRRGARPQTTDAPFEHDFDTGATSGYPGVALCRD